MNAGVMFMIHRIGTPQMANGGGKLVPAGDWWHDNPRGGQWGDKVTATRFTATNAIHLPTGGQWVEVLVEVRADVTGGRS